MQTVADHSAGPAATGSACSCVRDGERILAGHGGSMPGFIAAVYVSPLDKVGVAVLTNSSTRATRPGSRRSSSPRRSSAGPCRPSRGASTSRRRTTSMPLLGIWFMEGDQVVFRWREGTLEAQFTDAEDWEEPAVFTREADDRWRIVSGWEHGEALRIEQDRMVLAGYPVTREPGVWV